MRKSSLTRCDGDPAGLRPAVFAGIGFDKSDQVLYVLHRYRWMDREDLSCGDGKSDRVEDLSGSYGGCSRVDSSHN